MGIKKIRIVEEPKALDQEQSSEIVGGLTCTSYEPCSFLFGTNCGDFEEDGLCGDSTDKSKVYCSGYHK